MFVLLVAAELYGHKHCIEIGFPEMPSLDLLAGHCEATFRNECRRISGTKQAAPFILDNIKIFDDSLNRWVDLTTQGQLAEWCQLYLFQPDGVGDGDQGILSAPLRIRSPIELGTNKEKFFFLFHDMDFAAKGHLNREELQRVFNVMCLYEYSEASIDEYFLRFDTNRDGVLSFAEFTKWMAACPDVGEDLLKKSIEYWDACRRRPAEYRDSSTMTAQEREAILQYLSKGKTVSDDIQRREEIAREIQDEQILFEREQQLLQAKERFRSKYGRDPQPIKEQQPPISPPAPSPAKQSTPSRTPTHNRPLSASHSAKKIKSPA